MKTVPPNSVSNMSTADDKGAGEVEDEIEYAG
jgi:hypothetical protein